MAEETKERKPKNNFRIHLTGNKYIVGDSYSYWLVSESHRKDKNGNKTAVQKRLSGFHTDFTSLLESYFRNTIRKTEIDGEIADLVKLVKKVRTEVRTWGRMLDKAMEDEND